MVTGRPFHDLEQLDEVRALHRQQLGQRRAAAALVPARIISRTGGDAVAVEEHVLGAAKADALGAEGARGAGIGGGFGVGAHPHAPRGVGPLHDQAEIAGQLGLQHGDSALEHLTGGAVKGDDVAGLQRCAKGDQRAVARVDAQATGAGDARGSHAAGDNGGVAGHAATRGENASAACMP
jgi:hypothetical protein